jgi:effector-binding domain-containing protein
VRLIPIGRFSQLTRLSPKALRLYDQMGLLSPAMVDEDTGYRYYHLDQVNAATLIRLLRRGDMPLDDIRALLSEGDSAARRGRLHAQGERVQRRLREARMALDLAATMMEREDGAMPYEIEIKDVPDQSVLRVRVRSTMEGIPEAMGEAFSELMGFVQANGVQVSGPPLCVYAEEMGAEVEAEMWVCFPVSPGCASSERVEATVLPGGPMAWTMHRGPYETMGAAYGAVYSWIEEQKRKPAGPPRDIYLTDPEKAPPEEYLTEIQWPVA